MKTSIVIALFSLFIFTGVAGAADAAAGKTVFIQKCAMCHGADASGNTPMGKNLKIKDLHSPEVQSQPDADLKGIIAAGKNKMPSFKGKLTDAQIDNVLAYVRQLGK
jgi:mono/diheme cytochrome c family protein